MSYVSLTIRCSGPTCQRIKGESNHWYKVWEDEGKITFTTWKQGDEKVVGIRPLCGQACAQMVLSEYMNGKRDAET